MTAIDEIVRQPMAQALGWALLQFLWQGTLIGVFAAGILALLRRGAADVRYVVSTVALALMLTMPVVTAVQTYGAIRRGVQVAAVQDDARTGLETPARAAAGKSEDKSNAWLPPLGGRLRPAPDFRLKAEATKSDTGAMAAAWPTERWLPLLLTAWLAGVAVLTLRLLTGWLVVQRMKRRDARPVHEAVEGMARRLMRRLHIGRAVRFLESRMVDVPTVIGWLSPVVLLPASALAGLTPRQVEAILAHELAHIRRHDYLVNLLQAVVETLLFYHPAIWWLSHRIRVERENCCDDLAVSLCGDPVAYAAALAELEGLRTPNRELALAATGGSLLQRVKRLLGAPSHAGRAPGWLAAGVAVLVLAALTAGAMTPAALAGQEPIESDSNQAAASTPVAASPSVRPVIAAAPIEAASVSALSAVVATTEPVGAAPAAAAAVDVVPRLAAVAVEGVDPESAHASAAVLPVVAAPVPPERATQPVVAGTRATLGQRSSDGREQSGNYTWSENGKKLEVNYRGEIEFTADDTDVARMSPGAMLRIKDVRGWFNSDASIEFSADGSGNIQRRFWVGWSERPFEPEGRKWLAAMLPRFIRQSGIGAPARVARILKSGGVTGVLSEISLVEGSWAKRVYFSELMKSPGLTAADVQRAFKQAGAEIESDYDLASFLIASNRQITDDGARRAYLEAARSIDSDFELRRVLSSILKAGVAPPAIAAGLLETSTTIDSDFEEASLLVEFVGRQPIDATARVPFFKALDTVASAYERGRVLKAVLQRTDQSTEAGAATLQSASGVTSDLERAGVLLQFVKNYPVEGALRTPFFRAAASVDSSYEKGRVLQALAKRSDLSEDSVLELLRAAQSVSSNFERSQVLLAVASSQQLNRASRDAYIDAAEKLGDYEQGRVLSALVKNERGGGTK